MTVQQDVRADSWSVAGRTFTSRLIVGTGKYRDFEQNAAAVAASGAEIVTVAVRRVNVSDPNAPMLTDFIDPKKVTYLPNTAGCFNAEEAIRTFVITSGSVTAPLFASEPVFSDLTTSRPTSTRPKAV